MRTDDWDGFYAVARDPLIWEQHPYRTRWQEPVCRRFFDDGLKSGGGLIIANRYDGRVIGSSRYKPVAGADEVEIGWTFLERAAWGGAINGEVKRLVLAYALERVGTVTFHIGAQNLRSRRAVEKIGAVLTGRSDRRMIDGVAADHVVYAIDRTGFANGPFSKAG